MPMGRGEAIFDSGAKIRLKSAKKRSIFHILHANGGVGCSPHPTRPSLATLLRLATYHIFLRFRKF